jgi:hypothetical protein
VWRAKTTPNFSGEKMWREGGKAMASQSLLMNQTLAK